MGKQKLFKSSKCSFRQENIPNIPREKARPKKKGTRSSKIIAQITTKRKLSDHRQKQTLNQIETLLKLVTFAGEEV